MNTSTSFDLFGPVPVQKTGRGKAKPGKAVVDLSETVKSLSDTDFFGGKEEARIETFLKSEPVQDDDSISSKPGLLELFNAEKAWLKSDEALYEAFRKSVQVFALEYNLKELLSNEQTPEVIQSKIETLEWIFAEDVIGGIPAARIDGSFVLACHLTDRDPMELRRGLLNVDVVRDLIREYKPNAYLPPKKRVVMYSDFEHMSSPDEWSIHQFAGN